jgi:hypothetical protein
MTEPEGVRERVLDWSRAGGARAGLPDGSSAELYRVTRIP